ncbi:hypothetical protein [Streptomyces sp. Ru73]|uniref:hypothetical protein n=1 Tax=Streptomyces sp. Ru73 TaxID=2080748 RepID=UPI0011B0772B|nr:hypothetical protein [Streptomyces sp. Ru73]
MTRLLDYVRQRQRRAGADRFTVPAQGGHAGLVQSELAAELPDEDLGEELTDCLDLYEMGSKPRCEEVEFLELVREAIDRIESGQ